MDDFDRERERERSEIEEERHRSFVASERLHVRVIIRVVPNYDGQMTSTEKERSGTD